jgi:hypothetical protein
MTYKNYNTCIEIQPGNRPWLRNDSHHEEYNADQKSTRQMFSQLPTLKASWCSLKMLKLIRYRQSKQQKQAVIQASCSPLGRPQIRILSVYKRGFFSFSFSTNSRALEVKRCSRVMQGVITYSSAWPDEGSAGQSCMNAERHCGFVDTNSFHGRPYVLKR